jgi:aerotaxis receptor
VVKNRRKSGDHYWVEANVTPIIEDGKPCGYMSVRLRPTRAQVSDAAALYARLTAEREAGRQTIRLHLGRVRRIGWRDLPGRVHRSTLTHRAGCALLAMVGGGLLPDLIGLSGQAAMITRAALLLAVGGTFLAWLHHGVTARIEAASRFASDLASCNLRTSIVRNHYNPLGALIARLWQIQINLRAVMGDVRTEVSGTVQAVAEIARGSADLSARTEAQACSLQQTAAAMEALSGTVKNNAATAQQVSVSSEVSAAAAARGRQALDDLAESIQAINASSGKVTDIIQVIEGIAFQTNILALNAAVEAARAGDQGRGFAVVATEVRMLAHRSAQAAKEIRVLLGDSARHAQSGAERMKHTRATIDEAVDAVHRVGSLIRQIAVATQEQANGIAQVNAAVTHLDGMTQQNAALVEQSSAAAALLARRGSTLEQSVHIFRMDAGAGNEASAMTARAPVAGPR